MSESLRKYIVASSSHIPYSQNISVPNVQLIYKINEQGILQKSRTVSTTKKDIMGIYDTGGLCNCNADRLVRDIISEISRRNYSGVLLDFEESSSILSSVEKICTLLSQRQIIHFVPVELAALSKDSKIIIPSTISGGSFNEMVEYYKERYRSDRLCLEIVRCRNIFNMPSYKPQGEFINADEFDNIINTVKPSIFFSNELACKYFTYREEDKTRFVLFDDYESAIYKAKIADQNDFYSIFVLYSEWGNQSKIILNAI